MIYFRILLESLQFALHALRVNKLRTFLSLLGVTIGILTIVSVFSLVDSLERNIRSSVDSLGSEVIYIQKWPWGGGADFPWWKYLQRPEPSYSELSLLEKQLKNTENTAYLFGMNTTIKQGKNSAEGVTLTAVSHDYYRIWKFELAEGRYFSEMESRRGSNVAVLGQNVAEALFPSINPLGQKIKVLGRKLRVIGIIEKQGQSLVGNNLDDAALIPAEFMAGVMSLERRNGATLMATAKAGVGIEALRDELTGAMRSIRRLAPKSDNNFALNEISVISNTLDQVFQVIGLAGAVIGGFSILVGGFGIANIMFVSVRERTQQIGIQMSLGAKRIFILLQFLLESVILCLVGGGLGILMVMGIAAIANSQIDFTIYTSGTNVLQGLLISIGIGLIAGFVPAYNASRLDPVEAMRR